MSFININTNNLSRTLRNSTTFIDNWVYIPGTTITGDPRQPMLFESLNDFVYACGDHSPVDSKTFEYVAGILNSGLPVIFQRIAYVTTTVDGQTVKTLAVTPAQASFKHAAASEDDPPASLIDFKVYEKWGGTYGNSMTVTMRNTSTAIWIDVYYNSQLLEQKKVVTFNTTATQLEIATDLIKGLKTTEFDRIKIEVVNTNPATFNTQTIQNVQLSGGTDFNEDNVVRELPAYYSMITDKILYQPKFITSGGYTDAEDSSTYPIAEAMKNLTLIRQDCRALIDIPYGKPAEEQQQYANALGYQQLSDSQPIPSASICSPWQYMQVGSNQLWMPPSYAFLTVVGSAVSAGGEPYTPKAGITSGQVSNVIKPEFEIGSDLSEQWQSDTEVNINPIMRMQGGRYVIAGNSTLLIPEATGNYDNAFMESSIDLTVIEIRRIIYNVAQQLQYQYNLTEAFENFALKVGSSLDRMETEGAVMDYTITNVSSANEPRKLKVRVDVYLTPTIKAIEIYLNVAYGNVSLTTGGES